MESMIVKIVICIVVPIILLSLVMEKKTRRVALGTVLGCIMCLAAYYVNPWLQRTAGFSDYYLVTSAAPFVEEILKFVPVLVFSRFIARERRNILPLAFAVGVGFAIVENSFMLAQYAESSTVVWMFVRGIGTGLMHAMSTLIVGCGICIAVRDRLVYGTAVLATLFLAMMYHGAYNAIIQIPGIKYIGILLPVISYAIFIFLQNRKLIKKYLSEE